MQGIPAPFGVLGEAPQKSEARLLILQGRRVEVDPEDVAEPEVFADALMDHLLQQVAPPVVGGMRTSMQIIVRKHGPDADNFQPLRVVRISEKPVCRLQEATS